VRAPAFWQRDGLTARLLAPLSPLYEAATARRVARPGWRAPVPVICCGNASVGGAGKTTLALDLGTRLLARGMRVAFLTRRYGRRSGGAIRVDLARHGAPEVGDEALLLAALAPTFVAADRAPAARAAIAAGADVLIMDDGLQHPGLVKDGSLLVIDGGAGFGNGRVLPAGPLREPVAAAAARCRAGVLIGADAHDAAAALPPSLPVLRATLRSTDVERLAGHRVLAFAGIGRPEKFYASLAEAGAVVVATRSFPDHHPFSVAELRQVLADATTLDAAPVTTPKDAVRLPAGLRDAVTTIGVRLEWRDAAEIEALLDRLVASR
jgi:tetraacyldisaccharide 4'-kinase